MEQNRDVKEAPLAHPAPRFHHVNLPGSYAAVAYYMYQSPE
jgi:hypothetical protein